MVVFGQFLEVFVSGLLAGVLYSLVALGFVLIFKASGVFNFAQGAMVLFAALTLARLTGEVDGREVHLANFVVAASRPTKTSARARASPGTEESEC